MKRFLVVFSLMFAMQTFASAVTDLAEKLPSGDPAVREQVCRELVKQGEAAVHELASSLGVLGKGENVKSRYALHALAVYSTRNGGEEDRKVVVKGLSSALDLQLSVENRSVLLHQLRICGGTESVAAIAKVLNDDELCEPATQALLTINTPEAKTALRTALRNAKGSPRVTITRALGELRDRESVAEFTKDTESADATLRITAIEALANTGDDRALSLIEKAVNSESPEEHRRATMALLTFCERAGAGVKAFNVPGILQKLYASCERKKERQFQCAALYTLAQIAGEGAADDLFAAVKSDSSEVRGAAMNLLNGLPGAEITKRWIDEMKKAPVAIKPEIIATLVRRGDAEAFPAIKEALSDADKSVRLAAIAGAVLGKQSAIPSLRPFLDKTEGEEWTAAKMALVRITGPGINAAIVEALKGAPVNTQRSLISVLSDRAASDQAEAILALTKDKEDAVRADALNALAVTGSPQQVAPLLEILVKSQIDNERKGAENALAAICARAADRAKTAEPVLAAIDGATPVVKQALLRVVSKAGGTEGLPAVRKALKDENADVREAAIRALADWPDEAALNDVLATAKAAEKLPQNVVLLRGYLRIVKLNTSRPVADLLKLYQNGIDACRRPDEKRPFLSATGDVRDPAAYKMLEMFFGDETLKEDALAAAMRVGQNLARSEPAQARSILTSVIEKTKNENVKKDAQEALNKLNKSGR